MQFIFYFLATLCTVVLPSIIQHTVFRATFFRALFSTQTSEQHFLSIIQHTVLRATFFQHYLAHSLQSNIFLSIIQHTVLKATFFRALFSTQSSEQHKHRAGMHPTPPYPVQTTAQLIRSVRAIKFSVTELGSRNTACLVGAFKLHPVTLKTSWRNKNKDSSNARKLLSNLKTIEWIKKQDKF